MNTIFFLIGTIFGGIICILPLAILLLLGKIRKWDNRDLQIVVASYMVGNMWLLFINLWY